MRRRHKGYRNKDPRYFEKLAETKKKLRRLFALESKRKHGKRLTQ